MSDNVYEIIRRLALDSNSNMSAKLEYAQVSPRIPVIAMNALDELAEQLNVTRTKLAAHLLAAAINDAYAMNKSMRSAHSRP